ncbi:nucleoside diphosphate kinase [Violaceomyces palustris]|uniref:Nucleoside diphosphate kinase n=1 Tax=Violaceomyces palustris TaxID=1673888 RepID=A0ACD0P4U3_9BASI|nr:nucleoside diphosphate kinase [Violaceomyces palustris]
MTLLCFKPANRIDLASLRSATTSTLRRPTLGRPLPSPGLSPSSSSSPSRSNRVSPNFFSTFSTTTKPNSDPATGSKARQGEQVPHLELTLALIKPSVCTYQPDVTKILKEIKRSGLQMVRTKRLFWKAEDAHRFYAEHKGRFYYDRLIVGMTSGPSLAIALAGPNAISQWRSMLGPTKAYKAKWEQPQCLRARYGLGDTRNGFHGSDSSQSASRELGQVFQGWDTQWWLAQELERIRTGAT